MPSRGMSPGRSVGSTTAANRATSVCVRNTSSATGTAPRSTRPRGSGRAEASWADPDMRTRIIHVDPREPEPSALREAAIVLTRGGLVAFATETVYGLGADATNPAAVARIFEAKGRPAFNPLIVHASDPDMARGC